MFNVNGYLITPSMRFEEFVQHNYGRINDLEEASVRHTFEATKRKLHMELRPHRPFNGGIGIA